MEEILLKALTEELPRVLKYLEAKGEIRFGGFFTIFNPESDELLVLKQFGDIPRDKIQKYRNLSVEKAIRLQMNPGHRSSRESRNEELFHFGGAVFFKELGKTLSFSGLPEKADEALVLLTAIRAFPRLREFAEEIARESENNIYSELA